MLSLMMEPKTNAAFAEWAKATARGRSMRELARLSGISHTRISDMQFGLVPSYRLLERYCEVLNLPAEEREEGFRLAGYERPAASRPDPTYEHLLNSTVQAYGGGPIPPEDMEIMEAILRDRAAARERKRG